MSVIFGASGDSASSKHSSRILEPLLHWLFPNLSQQSFDEAVFLFRKGAHVTEYAILALMLWRAFCRPVWRAGEKWQWDGFLQALWFAMFYAATDEFHQTFVPSREGCIRDVCIDSVGAACGLLVLRALFLSRIVWLRRTWVVGASLAPWVVFALLVIHSSGLW